jgi:hypothetical protein
MVDAATNLRRASIAAAVLGLASVVVSSIVGHPLIGVFACVGLAFGAGNNWALQRSVRNYAAGAGVPKAKFSGRVFLRLGAITLIAIGIALIIRPDGLGVFAGLAVFQIVILISAAVPVFRSLRPTS